MSGFDQRHQPDMSVIFTKTCNNVYTPCDQSYPAELNLSTWGFHCDTDPTGIIYKKTFSKTVSGWKTIRNGRFLLNVEMGLEFDAVNCLEDGVEEPVCELQNIQWNSLDGEKVDITWTMELGQLEGVAIFSFNENEIGGNHPVVLKLYYTRLHCLNVTSG